MLRAAAAAVRSWTGIYTAGVPEPIATDRRRLIESDVWEQLRDGAGAISLAGRCLRGLPADLTWRLTDARTGNQTAHQLRIERTIAVAAPVSMTFYYALLSLLSWGALVGLAVNPTAFSLAFAGALLVAISLAGWAIELRAAEEPASSVWPPALAVSIARYSHRPCPGVEGGRTPRNPASSSGVDSRVPAQDGCCAVVGIHGTVLAGVNRLVNRVACRGRSSPCSYAARTLWHL